MEWRLSCTHPSIYTLLIKLTFQRVEVVETDNVSSHNGIEPRLPAWCRMVPPFQLLGLDISLPMFLIAAPVELIILFVKLTFEKVKFARVTALTFDWPIDIIEIQSAPIHYINKQMLTHWHIDQCGWCSVVLCANFQNAWIIEKLVMGKRYFTIFQFEVRFERIAYVAQPRKVLASPSHHQPWYCLRWINVLLFSMRRDFQYPCSLIAENWYKKEICFISKFP